MDAQPPSGHSPLASVAVWVDVAEEMDRARQEAFARLLAAYGLSERVVMGRCPKSGEPMGAITRGGDDDERG